MVSQERPVAEVRLNELLLHGFAALDMLFVVDKVVAFLREGAYVDAGVLARLRRIGEADGTVEGFGGKDLIFAPRGTFDWFKGGCWEGRGRGGERFRGGWMFAAGS